MRQDVLKTYKDVHSWVGIACGMFLFIAFLAGAVTMFKEPLTRWATPPVSGFSAPTPIDRADELVAAALAAHPKAAKGWSIELETGPENPARMTWNEGGRRDPKLMGANLAPDGTLEVHAVKPSRIGYLVDEMHRRVGLPFPNGVALPITTIVAMLYFVAIVSGVICLLPSLVKDLFAVRVGANLKRMWLDVHNLLGLFSLPFHVVIALSTIVFAFHDEIYGLQDKLIYQDHIEQRWEDGEAHPDIDPAAPLLPVTRLLAELKRQAPDFVPAQLSFHRAPPDHGGHMELRVAGTDDRYAHRGAVYGFAGVDPTTGRVVETEMMPGRQDGPSATLSSFFSLHFGSFGGAPVRWGYFLMGLSGTFLFYTGNLLWIESRRKRERRSSGPVTQSRQSFVLAALTVGVSLGAVIGLAASIAAAKLLAGHVADMEAWHIGVYYALFLAAIGWAFGRGAARAGGELLYAAAAATLLIPVSTLTGWSHPGASRLVDWVALALAGGLVLLANRSRRRARGGQHDSVWHAGVASEA